MININEIIAGFLEANFDDFQIYLEEEHAIETTEAEWFIDELRRKE